MRALVLSPEIAANPTDHSAFVGWIQRPADVFWVDVVSAATESACWDKLLERDDGNVSKCVKPRGSSPNDEGRPR